MSIIATLEAEAVAALLAAALPELQDFAIESLSGQVDLEKDELTLSAPTLLVAVVGGDHGTAGADTLSLAFVACVPGESQQGRRQQAMDACFAIRIWMEEADTRYVPNATRTERLHPIAVVGLFASLIG